MNFRHLELCPGFPDSYIFKCITLWIYYSHAILFYRAYSKVLAFKLVEYFNTLQYYEGNTVKVYNKRYLVSSFIKYEPYRSGRSTRFANAPCSVYYRMRRRDVGCCSMQPSYFKGQSSNIFLHRRLQYHDVSESLRRR